MIIELFIYLLYFFLYINFFLYKKVSRTTLKIETVICHL